MSLTHISGWGGGGTTDLGMSVPILTLTFGHTVSEEPVNVCLRFLSHVKGPGMTQGLPQGLLVRTDEIRNIQGSLVPRFSRLTICWNHLGSF